MDFLTCGQKLKKIRTLLNMKQIDLQDENVTRGLISMVEIDKRSLSRNTAAILANKFKKRASELGINLDIDKYYLLRSPAEDARLYCFKKLKDHTINYNIIKEIIKISDKFALTDVKSELYTKIGDLKFDKKLYIDALINYLKSIKIHRDINYYTNISYLY